MLVPWQGCTISNRMEALGKLQNSSYSTLIELYDATKTSRSVSTAINMRIEQTINHDAKKLCGITNFLTK